MKRGLLLAAAVVLGAGCAGGAGADLLVPAGPAPEAPTTTLTRCEELRAMADVMAQGGAPLGAARTEQEIAATCP